MVADSGTPARPDPLRPLNRPRPIEVLTRRNRDGEPEPAALVERGRRYRVEGVDDVWCVEDEWWRDGPVDRRYYRLALAGGAVRTVFHDRTTGGWYAQAY